MVFFASSRKWYCKTEEFIVGGAADLFNWCHVFYPLVCLEDGRLHVFSAVAGDSSRYLVIRSLFMSGIVDINSAG